MCLELGNQCLLNRCYRSTGSCGEYCVPPPRNAKTCLYETNQGWKEAWLTLRQRCGSMRIRRSIDRRSTGQTVTLCSVEKQWSASQEKPPQKVARFLEIYHQQLKEAGKSKNNNPLPCQKVESGQSDLRRRPGGSVAANALNEPCVQEKIEKVMRITYRFWFWLPPARRKRLVMSRFESALWVLHSMNFY